MTLLRLSNIPVHISSSREIVFERQLSKIALSYLTLMLPVKKIEISKNRIKIQLESELPREEIINIVAKACELSAISPREATSQLIRILFNTTFNS